MENRLKPLAKVVQINQWELTDCLFKPTSCAYLYDVITVPLIVATGEPLAGRAILVLPNPVHDFFELKIGEFAPLEARLFDENGRLVRTFSATELHGKLAVGDLAAGVYFLKIELENGRMEAIRFLKMD